MMYTVSSPNPSLFYIDNPRCVDGHYWFTVKSNLKINIFTNFQNNSGYYVMKRHDHIRYVTLDHIIGLKITSFSEYDLKGYSSNLSVMVTQ